MSPPDHGLSSLDLGATIRGFAGGQKLFGRYLLVRILGRGGMVWLARDEKLNRDVALKFLPELVMHDRTTLDDLKRETNRCLDLTHHNIVRIHDFIGDAQSACISMEYVDGPTLSALRVERPSKVFEVEELAPWIKQTCEALDYAHNHARIVHRDLKPANLMLNSKGDLKVADFGIARSLNDSVTILTITRGTSGTLLYMSPQQLDGERVSHLDDIYSMGATLYELLTSRSPFYSGQIDRQIRENAPISLKDRRAEFRIPNAQRIPREWEQTITACLAKDPAQRPQSAGEVALRLGLSGHFTVPGMPKSLQPEIMHEPHNALLKKRKRVLAAALVTLLVSAVVGGWWFTEQSKRITESQRLQNEKKVAEKGQLAAQQRAKEEEEKSKKGSLKATAAATKEQPYMNRLGMKFVPVAGTSVFFSIWETRVKDYKLFVEATKREWAKPDFKQTDFKQTEEHPAVNVSWDDATAFCKWLTEEERKAGRISPRQNYRLPSDDEWSAAVGLEQEDGATPEARSLKVKGLYPWGTKWPPPKGAGNYAGSEARTGGWPPDWKTIDGYQDAYPRTSPVGSFEANEYGIYDLGGNVWECCEDWWNAEKKSRVLRGATAVPTLCSPRIASILRPRVAALAAGSGVCWWLSLHARWAEFLRLPAWP